MHLQPLVFLGTERERGEPRSGSDAEFLLCALGPMVGAFTQADDAASALGPKVQAVHAALGVAGMVLAVHNVLAAYEVYEDRALAAPGDVPLRSNGRLGHKSPMDGVPGDTEDVAHRMDAFTGLGLTDQFALALKGEPRSMARCHLCSDDQVSGLRPHFCTRG